MPGIETGGPGASCLLVRTPDFPVEEQVGLGEQWRPGANYTYAWPGNNKLDQTLPLVGRIAGDDDGSVHVFGLHAVWSM